MNPALSRLIMFPWKATKLLISLMWSDNFAEISCNINKAKYHSAWGGLVGEGEVQFKALAGTNNNQIVCSTQPEWLNAGVSMIGKWWHAVMWMLASSEDTFDMVCLFWEAVKIDGSRAAKNPACVLRTHPSSLEPIFIAVSQDLCTVSGKLSVSCW